MVNKVCSSSDHKPVLATLNLGDSMPRHQTWRMDESLLTDAVSVAALKDALHLPCHDTASPLPWDELKSRWRALLVQEGRARRARITAALNDTLWRFRLVKRCGTLTFAMRDYVNALKSRYENLLRQSSRAASRTQILGRPVSDPAALRYVRAGSLDEPGLAHVPEVVLPDGTTSARAEDVCDVFTQHFARLLMTESTSRDAGSFEKRVAAFCGALPRVPDDMVNMLCAPVTTEGLLDCVRRLNGASAPGPDGIRARFYKTFFTAIREALFAMVNGFLLRGERPEYFREGRAILIAKPGGRPSDPGAYRSITLLNIDYKIVAWILTRRMGIVLPDIISRAQMCSVPGRTIFSSLALTRDLFDYASRTGIAGCFISVDQAKAFDRMEHRYMLGVLGLFGFPSEYLASLRLTYSGVSARLLVNGRLSDPFNVTRGITQGCPWSPLLFALCLDPLLRRVVACPSTRGFPLPGQGQVKVSAYADDVSLFLRDEDSYRAFTRLFSE